MLLMKKHRDSVGGGESEGSGGGCLHRGEPFLPLASQRWTLSTLRSPRPSPPSHQFSVGPEQEVIVPAPWEAVSYILFYQISLGNFMNYELSTPFSTAIE